MRHPFPTVPFGSPAAPPDAAGLVLVLLIAAIVVALDIPCMNYCLNDLTHRVIVTSGNKQLWAVIIILGGPLGQAAYWVYGRGPY